MGIFDFLKVGQIKAENEELKKRVEELTAANVNLRNEVDSSNRKYNNLSASYHDLSKTISGETLNKLKNEISDLVNQKETLNKDLQELQLKIKTADTALKAAQKAMKADNTNAADAPKLIINAASLMTHISDMHLNCLDVPALRKLVSANKTNIKKVIQKYEERYTTKSNQAIYQLMVIGLEAELQNVLINLKFGTVDKAKSKIKEITQKYYAISSNGNQSIAPTVKKFISEIEILYLEAIDIEYEYYTQKEKIKEEQRALKEQMRQEAEERKALEQQQKKLEKEENKYKNEIENVKIAISTSNQNEVEALKKRLQELTEQLNKIDERKEKIINLQNGQAGYVYIISNIGSFGDNLFKVGMTRRDEPQDRIDELGNASVPFPFDVHSFIFSSNAVELENRMHKILDSKRVNKINKRKEFFAVDINEIEHIVHEIEPSAEFKMTALAEQYNQSLSLNQ